MAALVSVGVSATGDAERPVRVRLLHHPPALRGDDGQQGARGGGGGGDAAPAPAPGTATAAAAAAPAPAPVPALSALAGARVLLAAPRPTPLLCELAAGLLRRGAAVGLALQHQADASRLARRLGGAASCAPAPLDLRSMESVGAFARAVSSEGESLDALVLLPGAAEGRRWYTPEGHSGRAQAAFLGPARLLQLLAPKLAEDGTAVLLPASPLHRLGRADSPADLLGRWAGGGPGDMEVLLLAFAGELARRLEPRGASVAAVDVGVVREQAMAGSLLRRLPPLRQLLHVMLPPAGDAAELMLSVAEDAVVARGGPGAPAADDAASGPQARAPPAGEAAAVEGSGGEEEGLGASGSADQRRPGGGVPAAEGDEGAELEERQQEQQEQQQEEEEEQEQKEGQGGGDQQRRRRQHQESGAASASAAPPAGPAEGVARAEEAEAEAVQPEGAAAPVPAERSGGARQAQPPHAQEGREVAGAGAGAPSRALKAFRYCSRGLLASPLLTACDLSGRSGSWLVHAVADVADPWFGLAAGGLVQAALLLDWPTRAWLLAPAGAVPAYARRLSPHAATVLAQLQRAVPGVEGVPWGSAQLKWVEVAPAGRVSDARLGRKLWQLVEKAAD